MNSGPLSDVTLDFSDGRGNARPTTLIAGANGSGKTTILDSIFNLAQIVIKRDRDAVGFLQDSEYSHMRLLVDGNKFDVISAKGYADEIGQYGDDYDSSNMIVIAFDYDSPRGDCEVKITGDTQDNIKFTTRFDGIEEIKYDKSSYVSANAGNTAPSFIYIPHVRFISGFQGDQVVREQTTYHWAYKYKLENNYLGSLNSYLVWLEYAEPETFGSAQKFVSALYNKKKTIEVIRRRLKCVIKTENGGQHDIEYLSSGEQNLLIIMLELQRRLTPHSIVLIDEIENSLHPKYQYRLGEMLKTLQQQIPFQLIATSHAPAFLDIFGVENTLILTEF